MFGAFRGTRNPVVHSSLLADVQGVVDRDHRIVAWAPGGDGLVEIRRAPEPGTAVNATTVFGSDPHPATPVRKGWDGTMRLHPSPQRGGRGHRLRG